MAPGPPWRISIHGFWISIFLIIQYPISPVSYPGLLGSMSTTQFIQDNKTRIENIDGNLDDAAITIIGADGRLEFYYFENGVLVSVRYKLHKWWFWVWDQWPWRSVTRDQDQWPVTRVVWWCGWSGDPRPETRSETKTRDPVTRVTSDPGGLVWDQWPKPCDHGDLVWLVNVGETYGEINDPGDPVIQWPKTSDHGDQWPETSEQWPGWPKTQDPWPETLDLRPW